MHETEEKIIRKALQYFALNDYQNASLNSIAKAIGVTKGAIYHYFESKDDLLKRCVYFFFDFMKNMLEEMVPEEMDITLEQLVGSFFELDIMLARISDELGIDFLNDYSSYLYILFTAFKKYPELKGEMSKLYFGSKSGLEMQLKAFQEKGEIRKELNCTAFANQLLVMSEGYMLFATIDQDDSLKVRKTGKEIVENLLYSLK